MDRRSFPPPEGDFAQALLRSAQADEPSQAAYAKAASALGVGVGLGVGASLAAPALVAVGAARWSGSALARLAGFGASGALLVAGGAYLMSNRSPVAEGSTATGTSLARPAAEVRPGSTTALASAGSAALPLQHSAAANVTTTPIGSPAVAGREARVAVAAVPRRLARAASAPSHGTSASSGKAASGSSLAEQVQSLDRARVALGSGDAGGALLEIAHYRKAWPSGVFLTEASVLEIEALAGRGERSRAAALASAFVAAHPDSPQAERLRALIPPEKR